MVTQEMADRFLTLVRAALPKYLAPERVTADVDQGMLCVRLDGRLAYRYGRGAFSWLCVEMGVSPGRTSQENAAMYRATRAAVKRWSDRDATLPA